MGLCTSVLSCCKAIVFNILSLFSGFFSRWLGSAPSLLVHRPPSTELRIEKVEADPPHDSEGSLGESDDEIQFMSERAAFLARGGLLGSLDDSEMPMVSTAPPSFLTDGSVVLGSSTIVVRDRIENQSMHGQYVVVKPRGLTSVKDAKKIPAEEAICESCHDRFIEENVLSVKCGCTFTLIHEECAAKEGSEICHYCHEKLEKTSVTLQAPEASAQVTDKQKFKKKEVKNLINS